MANEPVAAEGCGSFSRVNSRRKPFQLLLVAVVSVSFALCRRQPQRSFVQSLQCGMTRAEVTRLAHERGYDNSDPSWLSRSLAGRSATSKELRLVDLRFHAGRLVGLRAGTYDPHTKRISYRNIELCAAGRSMVSAVPSLTGTMR
jgi:hypothetical protein